MTCVSYLNIGHLITKLISKHASRIFGRGDEVFSGLDYQDRFATGGKKIHIRSEAR